jgi:hypothetical protein
MKNHVSTIFQLKIVLEDVRPQIMRRVQVPADIDLADLHDVFQVVMGWTDSHLHAFTIADVSYTRSYEDGDLEELDMEEECEVPLCDVVTEPKERFFYTYDFGDDWRHTVVLEKVLPPDPDTHYPVCLAGKRSCPPEDCGGVWGYKDLLNILGNPRHSEYKETKQWVGRKFDPEAFDLEKLNKALRRLRL